MKSNLIQFIWGDEVEYMLRTIKSNVGVFTVVDAIFYHPAGRLSSRKFFLNKFSIAVIDNKMRKYAYFRNMAYINSRYNKLQIFKQILIYFWFFIITEKLNIKGLLFYTKATLDGLLGIWGGEKKYLGK